MKQTQVITVPRGHNVGQTIKDHLIQCNLYGCIDIKSINPVRNVVNKSVDVTLQYVYKP